MSNWIEKDEGVIPIRKFCKMELDYLRIYPKQNRVMGKTRRHTKTVSGIEVSIEKTYWINIPISYYYLNDSITVFHLHGRDAETVLTLLSLHPDKLVLRYYPENQSQNMKDWGVYQECLTVQGVKLNKNEQIIKSNSVSVEGHIRKTPDPRFGLAGYGEYELPIKA